MEISLRRCLRDAVRPQTGQKHRAALLQAWRLGLPRLVRSYFHPTGSSAVRVTLGSESWTSFLHCLECTGESSLACRYWQFSASRKWEKTHQRKERAASAHAAAASPAQTRSQLNGLRRKAAFRKHKAQRAPSEPQPANMRRSWDVHVHAERDEPQSTTQRSAAHQEPLRQQQPQASAPLQHGGPSTSGRHSHHASPLFDGQTPAAAAATSRGNPHDQQISTAVFPVDFQQWGSLHACLAMLSLHLLHTSAVHHNSSTALQAEDGSSSSLVPAVHRGSSSSNHGDSNSAREARKHDSDAALAGMQGLQSQLAGLRRRSAMRPV